MHGATTLALISSVALAGGPFDGLRDGLRNLENKVNDAIGSPTPAPAPAPTEGAGNERYDAATRRWTAEIPGFTSHAAQQRHKDWCWAACAEMVHAHYRTRTPEGEPITQERIAQRVTGVGDPASEAARAASYYEIMWALNPDLDYLGGERLAALAQRALEGGEIQFNGRSIVESYLQRTTLGVDTMIPALQQGHPVVAGLRHETKPDEGHAYVVYGAVYEKNGAKTAIRNLLNRIAPENRWAHERLVSDTYRLVAALAIDPQTRKAIEIPVEEFARRVDFMISRPQAREILEKEMSVVTVAPR